MNVNECKVREEEILKMLDIWITQLTQTEDHSNPIFFSAMQRLVKNTIIKKLL